MEIIKRVNWQSLLLPEAFRISRVQETLSSELIRETSHLLPATLPAAYSSVPVRPTRKKRVSRMSVILVSARRHKHCRSPLLPPPAHSLRSPMARRKALRGRCAPSTTTCTLRRRRRLLPRPSPRSPSTATVGSVLVRVLLVHNSPSQEWPTSQVRPRPCTQVSRF